MAHQTGKLPILGKYFPRRLFMTGWIIPRTHKIFLVDGLWENETITMIVFYSVYGVLYWWIMDKRRESLLKKEITQKNSRDLITLHVMCEIDDGYNF